MVQVLEQEKYQLRRQLEVAEEEYQLRYLHVYCISLTLNPDISANVKMLINQ